MSGVSKAERATNRGLAQVFREFREIVLNNRGYRLGTARELFEKLSADETKQVLEMFNQQEGSLLGELEEEYIKLAYSSESLAAKMKEGLTFYEALGAIAREIKGAHIELNPDLVQSQVQARRAELLGTDLIEETRKN